MKFKVGNRVEHEFYGKGTVIGVSVTDTPLVEFDNHFSGLHGGGHGEVNGTKGKDGHCGYADMIKPLKSQTIVIYPKGLETIALLKDGKKIIKQASAKCNPSDTYDFNIGARLAFSRLVGGIYIGGVDMAIDTIREVKRPAKVGEWVKIIDAKPSAITTMEYKNGYILQITHLDGPYRHYGKYITDYLYDDEYVVLESYQPEETTGHSLSMYTDKELIDELARRWEDKTMNERVLNLLSMCMQAKEKGHHVFFDYSPHADSGEVVVSVHKNGWKKDVDPDKRFMVTISGEVGCMESSFAEVEAYLKGLIA